MQPTYTPDKQILEARKRDILNFFHRGETDASVASRYGANELVAVVRHLIAPKPWTLPEPPKGKQWHRANEWTENMLPEGYRPLLDGEVAQIGDEYYFIDEWFSHKEDGKPITSEKSKAGGAIWCLHRTRRPMPTEPRTRPWSKPEDVPLNCWIREKGFAQGASLVCGVADAGIWILGTHGALIIEWDEIGEREHSTDRKTWAKCEVTE